ncbi:MAG: hypothetical protein EBR15_08660 [Gammaproteobacteria bacterium]|nr:hypothetical protein [Gammaproteobacteria bacterium]
MDKSEDGQLEFLGQLHQAQGLAVALGLAHAEVAQAALARHFGAVAIDRSRAGNVVQAYVDEFARAERMAVTIAPEGTRSKVNGWKRGYHRIARAAGVPIVTAALDYSTRTLIFGAPREATEDADQDERELRRDFAAHMARIPSKY